MGYTGKGGMRMLVVSDKKASYAYQLRKCGSKKALAEGKLVHREVAENGYGKSTYLGNLLIQMYGNCGEIDEAREAFRNMEQTNVYSWNIMMTAFTQNGHFEDTKRLFEKMPQRDVVSWSAMIAANAQNSYLEEAVELFRKMQLDGVKPERPTLISVLDACAGLSRLVDGKVIHGCAIECGIGNDVAVGTSLIIMYGKCGSSSLAKEVFNKMPERDLVSWTALLTVLAQSGQVEEGENLFRRSPELSLFSWNLVIWAYAQKGEVNDAKCVFDQSPDKDVAMWNTMIGGFAQNGQDRMAMKMFLEMVQEGIQPSKVTFLCIFEACSSISEAKACHSAVRDCGYEDDTSVVNSLITMYGICGNVHLAKQLFDELYRPNMISCTAMIASYARTGHGKQAVEMTQWMDLEGMELNSITFVNILSACSHAGLLHEGHRYFVSMFSDRNIEPTISHYRCVIDLFARAGQLGKAEEFVGELGDDDVVIASVAWTTLLGACRIHGDFKRGIRAAGNAQELDPVTLVPRLLMSNMFAESGQCF